MPEIKQMISNNIYFFFFFFKKSNIENIVLITIKHLQTNQILALNNPYRVDLLLNILAIYWVISLMSRVFANGAGDQGSIPDQVIPKTQKMVLDTSLLNTQHYKVRIKGKVE